MSNAPKLRRRRLAQIAACCKGLIGALQRSGRMASVSGPLAIKRPATGEHRPCRPQRGKVDNGACQMPPWFSICAPPVPAARVAGQEGVADDPGRADLLECTDPLAVIDVPHFAAPDRARPRRPQRRGELHVFSIVKREKRQTMSAAVRLTSLAHGGGCGCKLAPSVLRELLGGQPATRSLPAIAGRHRDRRRRRGLAARRRHAASSPPPISSCRWWTTRIDFGRIAATNAISDIYAMGGQADHGAGDPRHADRQDAGRDGPRNPATAARTICADAGIPVAGGHSIDAPEPIYGLAVIGTCRPQDVRRNSRRAAGRRADPDQGAGRRASIRPRSRRRELSPAAL